MSRRSEEKALRKVAESGDMNAAYDLASMLDEGGDMAGAEGWYRFASTRGHLDSAAELGTMLWKRGEFKEGESWLRKATTSDDPVTANYSAGVLGKCLISLGRADEAEQWLIIAADAGMDFATEALEKLREERTGGRSDVLQTFEVSYVTFYDGSGHRLGPSRCTLTKTRLIIDDARSGIHQILLRDISGISTPSRFGDPKTLRISLPVQAYDVTFKSKVQKYSAEGWLSKAIHG